MTFDCQQQFELYECHCMPSSQTGMTSGFQACYQVHVSTFSRTKPLTQTGRNVTWVYPQEIVEIMFLNYIKCLICCIVQESAQKRLPIMLVANKIDLRSEQASCVKFEDGQRLARVSMLVPKNYIAYISPIVTTLTDHYSHIFHKSFPPSHPSRMGRWEGFVESVNSFRGLGSRDCSAVLFIFSIFSRYLYMVRASCIMHVLELDQVIC